VGARYPGVERVAREYVVHTWPRAFKSHCGLSEVCRDHPTRRALASLVAHIFHSHCSIHSLFYSNTLAIKSHISSWHTSTCRKDA